MFYQILNAPLRHTYFYRFNLIFIQVSISIVLHCVLAKCCSKHMTLQKCLYERTIDSTADQQTKEYPNN